MNAPIRDIQPAGSAGAITAFGAPSYVPLKVHSAYSLLEGALPFKRIATLAEANAYPAVGLTDTNNLFGALEFSNTLAKAGIQPIIGVALTLAERDTAPRGALAAPGDAPSIRPAGLIALYAMSDAGYANMMKLVSRAHLAPGPNEPVHITIADLEELGCGMIALSGGADGPINRAIIDGQDALAADRLGKLSAIFGDRLYVEIQRHADKGEREIEAKLLEMAYAAGAAIVATNETYFAEAEDHEAHDALICIAEGRYVVEDDRRRLTPEHYFKAPDQMARLFADLPEALANTSVIAKRCAFRVTGRAPILPRFVQAAADTTDEAQLQAEADELGRQAREGLKARLAKHGCANGFTTEDYEKRLDYELGIISGMKFPGYFLIVADFIKWAKRQGIPVGPGRGSGAGSVVAWVLTITDLDPLQFGLLFERFLNPERLSMPDFDIDFCQDRRDEVIRYVQGKYGADRVAQIITHGKLQARAVLRDVGRVLQMPYGQVDRLCKLVPNNPANPVTLADAIEDEPRLQEERDNEQIVAELLAIALKLEGLYRHASTHAAGLVIGDRPLDELVPLYRDPKSNMPVTQFNWKMVEAAGLVKFDFLGLKTLTVLQKAVDLVKAGRGITVDLPGLALDDGPTFELLAKADTVGVFQLESTGMRESLKKLRPDRFEDIIAMVSLYRPGPMDNIPTYIARKHGEEKVDYLHEMLSEILAETYGVIIYQEQVIQIAQVMGGYSLGEADVLRRAMGKKDKLAMAQQQMEFVTRAVEKGVDKRDARFIFEQVDKFAGYGFNKSHAAAYALVSYHTAYMKANYREEFLAASMTLDMGQTDKLAMFAAEAQRSGIPLLPPSVNASHVDFIVEQPRPNTDDIRAVRYSLAALKNIGASAVETIVKAREADGPFRSLGDFAERIDPKAVNKRGIEMLAKSGAFDDLADDRAQVCASAGALMALAQRTHANAAAGTSDLFGGGGAGGADTDQAASANAFKMKAAEAWTPLEQLGHELSAIGFYLSGHPLDQYTGVLEQLGVSNYNDFAADVDQDKSVGRLAAIIISARIRKSARGNPFAFAMFSDATAQFEAVMFSEALGRAGDLLEPGTPVLLTVEAQREDDAVKLLVQNVESLDAVAGQTRKHLRLTLDPAALIEKGSRAATGLARAMRQPTNGSGGQVLFQLQLDDLDVPAGVTLRLPRRLDIGPDAAGFLATRAGVVQVADD